MEARSTLPLYILIICLVLPETFKAPVFTFKRTAEKQEIIIKFTITIAQTEGAGRDDEIPVCSKGWNKVKEIE